MLSKCLIDRSAQCPRFISKQYLLTPLFRSAKSSEHNDDGRKRKRERERKRKNGWTLITSKWHEWKVNMATNCRHRFDGDWRMSWSFVNVITFTRGIRVSEHGARHSIDKPGFVVPFGKYNQWSKCLGNICRTGLLSKQQLINIVQPYEIKSSIK